MSRSPENVRPRSPLAWLPMGLSAFLAALAWRVPPDGHEHGDLAQFFGRFHPLFVHLPVALLLIVPLMELVGRGHGRAHVRAAAGFVLWAAAIGAVASAFAGWLLAWSGGYNSGTVTWHMWSSIALAALASAAAMARGAEAGTGGSRPCSEVGTGGSPVRADFGAVRGSRPGEPPGPTSEADLGVGRGSRPGEPPGPTSEADLGAVRGSRPGEPPGPTLGPVPANKTYCILLIAAVALMFWTGEQGGEISHGDDYLTEHMPSRLQRLLGVEAPQAKPAASAVAPRTAFAARIEPLLQRSCVSCHNAKRAKGGLRLDSYEWLMKGSKDGLVVVPWDPADSELIHRVSLPSSDEDFMPADGRKPLSPAEVKLFERWIAAGASAAQPASTLQ
jgi:hypothetical protein